MKDRFFYPLAILFVVIIIGGAMLPGFKNRGPTIKEATENGYSLSGEDLKILISAEGTILEFRDDPTDGSVLAVMSTNIPRDLAPPTQGVFDTLANVYEQAFSGKRLKVTITARAGKKNPLDKFKTAYFTFEASSGWQSFSLSPEFKDYVFTYNSPIKDAVMGREYLGIWPGDGGDRKAMEVKAFRVEIIDGE